MRVDAAKDLVQVTRAALDITQAQFAELLDVHVMTVSKWERGVLEPSAWHVDLFEAICDACMVDDRTGERVKVCLRGGSHAHALYEALRARFG